MDIGTEGYINSVILGSFFNALVPGAVAPDWFKKSYNDWPTERKGTQEAWTAYGHTYHGGLGAVLWHAEQASISKEEAIRYAAVGHAWDQVILGAAVNKARLREAFWSEMAQTQPLKASVALAKHAAVPIVTGAGDVAKAGVEFTTATLRAGGSMARTAATMLQYWPLTLLGAAAIAGAAWILTPRIKKLRKGK